MEWRQQTSVSSADAFNEAKRWIEVAAGSVLHSFLSLYLLLRRAYLHLLQTINYKQLRRFDVALF